MLDIVFSYGWEPVPIHRIRMNTRNVIILFLDNICQLRSEGSKLNNANDVTRAMWFEEFRVPFPRPGSMFRGNPPQVKIHPII